MEAAPREDALRRLGESNEQIRALAYQDGLTGLPNRRLFNEHLEKVLARARAQGHRVRGAVHRRRQLQAHQRHGRPPGGRRSAAPTRRIAVRADSLRRRARPVRGRRRRRRDDDHDRADRRLRVVAARRRRVHHPVARHARSIRRGHGRAPILEAPRAADPRRGARGVRDREHRHRDFSRGRPHERDPDPQRRHGDVSREAAGQGGVPILFGRDERGFRRAAHARERPAARARGRQRSSCTISRRSTCGPAASSAPRRCCAGGIRSAATSRRQRSSRSPRTRA